MMNQPSANCVSFKVNSAILLGLYMLLSVCIGCTESIDMAEQLNEPIPSPSTEKAETTVDEPIPDEVTIPADELEEDVGDPKADVTAVSVSGNPGAYTFKVTVESPDTGCDQYADWWEVLSEDGDLLYRRILLHSHVGEQPFTRSGNPVPVAGDVTVIVRAHMNSSGYGGVAQKGTVEEGFDPVQLPEEFAMAVENQDPQPEDCAF